MFLGRGGRGTGVGAVVDVRNLREIEVWGLCVNGSRDRGGLAGVGACQSDVNNLEYVSIRTVERTFQDALLDRRQNLCTFLFPPNDTPPSP